MVKFGLVASGNGLGHARRMMHLALSLNIMNHDARVFASGQQIKRLIEELKDLGKFVNFIEIRSHGIDGPVWFNTGCKIEKPSTQIIKNLQECQVIVSDNSIWPSEYHDNFLLFGHFNWIDYWEQKNVGNRGDLTVEMLEKERSLLMKSKAIFQFIDFSNYKRKDYATKVVPLKLFKYESDKIASDKKSNLIWAVSGTTGLADKFNYLPRLKNEYEIQLSETFRLMNSVPVPSLVIGRPGLSTIRDCLASGIVFLPYLDEDDPELKLNIDSLINLGLTHGEMLVSHEIHNIVKNILNNSQLIDRWQNAWKYIFAEPKDVCEKILHQCKISGIL